MRLHQNWEKWQCTNTESKNSRIFNSSTNTQHPAHICISANKFAEISPRPAATLGHGSQLMLTNGFLPPLWPWRSSVVSRRTKRHLWHCAVLEVWCCKMILCYRRTKRHAHTRIGGALYGNFLFAFISNASWERGDRMMVMGARESRTRANTALAAC